MSERSRSAALPRARPPGFARTELPATPRVLSPRAIGGLWLVVGILLVIGVLAWRVSVPLPVDGLAIGPRDPHGRVLVVFPASARPYLDSDAPVAGGSRWTGTIERIEDPDPDLARLGVPAGLVDPHAPWCAVWVRVAPEAAAREPLAPGQARPVRAIIQRTALSLWWDDATDLLPSHDGGPP